MASAMGKAITRSMKGKKVAQPSLSPWGSIVNAQLKAKVAPPPTSNLSKFLGLPPPSGSDFSDIVAKFVRINAGRAPGKRKQRLFEEKLRAVLGKGKNIGVHDIAKLMSEQFATKA